MSKSLYHLTAFSTDPSKGNPAGVWIGDELPDTKTMQSIAAEVGYSETAFIAPASGNIRTIRYYSPLTEINFCGHATIASAVMLGRLSGTGTYQLDTAVGRVPVEVRSVDGQIQAALTSVAPSHKPASTALVDDVLALLQWSSDELDLAISPALAYGGVWHLILAVNSQSRLSQLDYDFEKLKALMLRGIDHAAASLSRAQRPVSLSESFPNRRRRGRPCHRRCSCSARWVSARCQVD